MPGPPFPRIRILTWLVAFAAHAACTFAVGGSSAAAPLVKVGEFDLLHARQGAASIALGNYIYVFGGAATGAITHAERIDTRTNQVEVIGSAFLPRRYHGVLEHDGKIYLFGGQGYGLPDDPYERAVEIYDPATGSITQGAPMPRPRSGMAVAKHGNKAYLIGGTKKKDIHRAQTNDTDIFDFATGRWSEGLPMPTPRESRAVTIGDLILVVGGFRVPKAVSNVEMFVPAENVWKALPPLNRTVSAHSLAFLGEHLFLFGDYDRLDSVLAYNLRTRRTAKLDPAFKGARHTTATVCQGRIYVMGGNLDTGTADEQRLVQVFAPNPAYIPE